MNLVYPSHNFNSLKHNLKLRVSPTLKISNFEFYIHEFWMIFSVNRDYFLKYY